MNTKHYTCNKAMLDEINTRLNAVPALLEEHKDDEAYQKRFYSKLDWILKTIEDELQA